MVKTEWVAMALTSTADGAGSLRQRKLRVTWLTDGHGFVDSGVDVDVVSSERFGQSGGLYR